MRYPHLIGSSQGDNCPIRIHRLSAISTVEEHHRQMPAFPHDNTYQRYHFALDGMRFSTNVPVHWLGSSPAISKNASSSSMGMR